MPDFFETEIAVQDAKAIAFDGCHKIYVLMDDAQVEKMRSYGYGDDDGSFLVTADEVRKVEMLDILKDWYAGSCSLKFINGVTTMPEGTDPNEGFTDLIPQGADWQDDEDEDDYEDGEDEDDEDY